MGKKFEVDPLWMGRIADSLNGLEYGSVQIVVHEGKIVQIERTEKKRYGANEEEARRRTERRGS